MTISSCQQPLPIKPLYIKQFFDRDSCTYTYLLVDPNSHEGAIIDGVKEQLKRDLQYIEELGIELLYAIETHVHADHISSAGLMRQKTGAQIVYNKAAAIKSIDIELLDGDELPLGHFQIKAISTPGHTCGCMSYYIDNRVFTGDTLLIRGCGRSDFQQGSSEVLYRSVTEKLFNLPEETVVYPGHDYNGNTSSTIAEEKQWNARLGKQKSLADFIDIMDNLNLALPKKINEAVPANEGCGINFNPNIYVHEDFSMSSLYQIWQQENPDNLIIDNRTEEEYLTGHIPNSKNIPLGTEPDHLEALKDFKHIYIYCHSGRRSQTALTNLAMMGLENITCVSHSGLPEWEALGYPIAH
ncbi:MBL fold metallo-hydrolase [Colwellia sp. 12G3]|uniref:MBL fold metallo-hydrolase n=1 Tax=Colwellia sp. 12G3 TaxID=2058299 RepID=UPI000C348CDB|nr:MBL fold metallo-hydrolase [Colwellia sp. 12G3]PKI17692.1 MBL fold metallo-hydrolase [Colwellia sp. 12G3]